MYLDLVIDEIFEERTLILNSLKYIRDNNFLQKSTN